jgi:hypothetical protein
MVLYVPACLLSLPQMRPVQAFWGAFFTGAALRLRFLKRIWGNQFPQTPNQRLPALRLCVIEAR